MNAEEVRDSCLLVAIELDDAFGVGDGTLDLLYDRCGVVHDVDQALRVAGRLRHLSFRVLQIVDLGGLFEYYGLWNGEGVAEARVESGGEVAGELEVLALVFANRHCLWLVKQDVGGLKDRVGEEPDACAV